MLKEDNNFHWYVLSVRRSQEDKIIKKINWEVNYQGCSAQVKQLKTANLNDKPLKGFLFCEIDLDSKLLRIFYKITGVIVFLNHERNIAELPNFVENSQITNMLNLRKETLFDEVEQNLFEKNKEKDYEQFQPGDLIKIKNGDFESYQGKIIKINYKTQEANINLDRDEKNSLNNNIYLERFPLSNCLKIKN